jgi:ribosomal protein S18 acetylase RimI-like enzyme
MLLCTASKRVPIPGMQPGSSIILLMKIERLTTGTEELFRAFQELVPQLTANHPPPDRSDVDALTASPGSILLIARGTDDEPIIGMATLIVYCVPTGIRARLEDVIVDGSARRLGIGEALTREALRIAKESGADGVALTSSPRRDAANRLYQKMGFKPWKTNLYFYLGFNSEVQQMVPRIPQTEIGSQGIFLDGG